ncbi:putative copper homeostasis (lipo)protein LpqS [Mycobacterium intracellulare]
MTGHSFQSSYEDRNKTWGTSFASAVLPNSPSSVLVGLGMALAVAAVAAWLAPRVVLAGRGPPSAPATALTGQDLLTRLGLSRR